MKNPNNQPTAIGILVQNHCSHTLYTELFAIVPMVLIS